MQAQTRPDDAGLAQSVQGVGVRQGAVERRPGPEQSFFTGITHPVRPGVGVTGARNDPGSGSCGWYHAPATGQVSGLAPWTSCVSHLSSDARGRRSFDAAGSRRRSASG